MEQEPLLNISEASRFLVVSEAALRLWTDEGRLKAFITPGGHRRYSRAELKRFLNSHQRTLSIRDLVVEIEDTARLHREIGRTSISVTPWYNKLSRESREHLVELGPNLLKLIARYVSKPSSREESIKLACDIGHDFGETLAKLEMPLTDSVEAFISHRDPIMKAATHLMRKKRRAFTGRIVEAIPMVTHIMDEALVSLVAAHQQYQAEIQSKAKGGDGR